MKRLSKISNKLSLEEILVDRHAKTFNDNFQKLEEPISELNILKFFVFVVICILIIFGRIFYLNIIKGNENYIISENNRTRYILIKAPRGVIYDRYNNAIVSNKTSLSLILLPRDFFDQKGGKNVNVLNHIASIFSIDLDELNKIINKINVLSYEPILIKTSITSDMARLFEADIKENNNLGFYIIEDYMRSYSDSNAFTHVVGYTGRMNEDDIKNNPAYPIADLIGKYGLESKYEKYLHGLSGKKMMEVDAKSKINPELGILNPKPGDRLITTIDKELQQFLYDALVRSVNKLGLKKGTAMMTNPKTGEILAMVSFPSINADAFSSGSPKNIIQETLTNKYNPFINRSISGLYSPGSTIKPLVAIGALMENLINPEDNIKDVDAIVIPNKYNPDKPSVFKDWKNHG
jgi:penicillin-binding protein 2